MKWLLELMCSGTRFARFCAEHEAMEFKANLTNEMRYSAKKWSGSPAARAAIAVFLMLDCRNVMDDQFVFDFFSAVSLVRSGNNVFLKFYSNKVCLLLCYNAFTRRAAYSLSAISSGRMLSKKSIPGNRSSHYEISAKEIIDSLTEIVDALR